jgi:hypothetical protein
MGWVAEESVSFVAGVSDFSLLHSIQTSSSFLPPSLPPFLFLNILFRLSLFLLRISDYRR